MDDTDSCRSSSQRRLVIAQEDLFAESLSDFPPVFLDEMVSEGLLLRGECDERSTRDEMRALLVENDDTQVVKNGSVSQDYFDNLCPEGALNEELGMPSKTDSTQCDLGVDHLHHGQQQKSSYDNVFGVQTVSKISEVLLNSLIHQLMGILTPTEICRSLSCFVPVIPLQDVDIANIRQIIKRRSDLCRRTIARRMGRRQKSVAVAVKSRIKSVKTLASDNQSPLSTEYVENINRKPSRSRSKVSPSKNADEETIRKNIPSSKGKTHRTFSCLNCSRGFRIESAFQNHQRPFDDQNVETRCTTCDTDLKHPNCLSYHRSKLHGEDAEIVRANSRDVSSSRVCEVCNKTFTRIAGLVYHRRRSHNLGKSVERKYNCKQCHKSFLQKSHLVSHKKGHQLKRQLGKEDVGSDDSDFGKKTQCPTCDICGKLFTRATGLIYHQRQVHGIGGVMERKYDCDKCEKSFLKKSHLILHGQSHTGERLFPCRFCERSFGGTSGRRIHEEKVHGENGNDLSQEEIQAKRAKVALKIQDATESGIAAENQKKHNPDVPREYSCSYCPKVFPRPSAKRVHERRHTGEKPFLCMVCGNAYKSSVALKEHEKIVHTHTLDLLCTICGAAFGRQMSLKYHILSRHVDKKFTCDQEGCGRSFVQRAKLVRHQRIHNLGLHQCNICNRALESDDLLKRHILVHEMRKMKDDGVSGVVIPRNPANRKKLIPKRRKERKTPAPVRKLQCVYCEKRFPYQNELDKHTKAVHLNEREFKCPEAQCSKAFISHYKLQNHLRKAHGHVIENNLLADVECDECGKVVQGVARLAIHKRSRHSGANSKHSKLPVITFGNLSSTSQRSKSRASLEVTSTVPSTRSVNASELTIPVVLPSTMISQSESPASLTQPQPDTRINQNSISATIPHSQNSTVEGLPLRSSIYTGAQEQFPFVNFTSGYSTVLPPSNFLYSSVPLTTSHFHQTDYDNAGNFWQTHQNQLTNRPQQQPLYQSHISPAQLRQVDPLRENYHSSDYSDLIRIPYHGEMQYQEGNDANSTTNDNEEDSAEPVPEATVQHIDINLVGKRGRPRKVGATHAQQSKAVKTQATNQKVARHPRKPLPKKKLPCPVCNKFFGTNQHLRTHQQIHERKEIPITDAFKCLVCGKTFSRSYYLTVHSVIHDPTLKPFKCSEPGCRAEFRAPGEFRKHKTVHSIKTFRKYRCKICKEEKPTSGELHSHVITDHADKMHACTHPGCNFMCPTASRLKRHSEQHQEKGERLRPYKCPFCECSYIRGENLQQHLDTSHDGAATAVTNPNTNGGFTCHICPKQFEFEWKVKSHIRKTHGKNRKSNYIPRSKPLFYYCEDCDWSFPNAAALRRHIKSYHKGDPIPCLRQPCDKKYFYVNKLENHLKSQHDNFTNDDKIKLDELRIKYPAEPEIEEDLGKESRRKRSSKHGAVFEDFEDDFLDDDEEDESDLEFYMPSQRKSKKKPKKQRGKGKRKTRYADFETLSSDIQDSN